MCVCVCMCMNVTVSLKDKVCPYSSCVILKYGFHPFIHPDRYKAALDKHGRSEAFSKFLFMVRKSHVGRSLLRVCHETFLMLQG